MRDYVNSAHAVLLCSGGHRRSAWRNRTAAIAGALARRVPPFAIFDVRKSRRHDGADRLPQQHFLRTDYRSPRRLSGSVEEEGFSRARTWPSSISAKARGRLTGLAAG
jgi:hypothetical protein